MQRANPYLARSSRSAIPIAAIGFPRRQKFHERMECPGSGASLCGWYRTRRDKLKKLAGLLAWMHPGLLRIHSKRNRISRDYESKSGSWRSVSLVGGLASGSFYVPYRGVKGWAWETFWLAGGFFSWIIAPWFLAGLLTKDLFAVLHEAPGQQS